MISFSPARSIEYVSPLRWRRLWLAIGWTMVITIIYLSLAPVSIPGPEGVNADKWCHVIAYGALMLWFAQLYESRAARMILCLLLFALGVGFLLPIRGDVVAVVRGAERPFG